jgi:carboxypeptidase PM20D1
VAAARRRGAARARAQAPGVRRALVALAFALAALAALLAVRTARFDSRQPAVPALPPVAVEVDALAGRLAAGLRYPTISHADPAQLDLAAFRGFHRLLEEGYPRLRRALAREVVNEGSLLYTWKGRDPSLPPVLLAAHIDVVPVDAGSEARWTHPPFDGVVEGGYVWGRGAMDDKASLFCILDAVEGLLVAGFEPERTLLLAFGHDEEVGGEQGAAQIAARLAGRDARLAYVLDEGGAVIAPGYLPGVATPIATIGIAEKGWVSVTLEADATGGHSSTPPRHTAVGLVAAAVARLEDDPLPGRVDGTTALLFDHLGPELPLAWRVLLANRWLFAPLLELGLARTPATDAMLRTTTAATLFSGGVKDNVLPTSARAVVNFRIHPRDTLEQVVEHVRRVVDDERVKIGFEGREASAVAPTDSEAFAAIARALREVFPEAVAVPFLVLGGTDARHYAGLTPRVYRFTPFEYGRDALERVHGTDERISLENLVSGVRFYRRLVERTAGPPVAP